MNTPVISAIIPCFNQALYLGEAIDSVIAQTFADIEIIVVDDGSTDNTAAIASRCPGVRLVSQRNSGLAAARNSGMRESQGQYLVFLDADDRLLPSAIAEGYKCLREHPDSAFARGHFRWLEPDGTTAEANYRTCGDEDPYAWLLQGNHIVMHATVIYRRDALEGAGGFDASLPVCEDYDLYLRIARQHQIAQHDRIIAEYRRHDASMSRNSPKMLATVLTILQSQSKYIESNAQYEAAYRTGVRFWKEFYGLRSLRRIAGFVAKGQPRRAWRDALSLIDSVGAVQLPLSAPVWLGRHMINRIRPRGV